METHLTHYKVQEDSKRTYTKCFTKIKNYPLNPMTRSLMVAAFVVMAGNILRAQSYVHH